MKRFVKTAAAVLLVLAVTAVPLTAWAMPSEYFLGDLSSIFAFIADGTAPFHADSMLYPVLPVEMGDAGNQFFCSDFYSGAYEESEDFPYLYSEGYAMVYPTIGCDLLPHEAVRSYLFKGKFDCEVRILKGAAEGRAYLEKALEAKGAEAFKSASGFDGVLTESWFFEECNDGIVTFKESADRGAEGATCRAAVSLLVNDVFWVTFEAEDRSDTDFEVYDYTASKPDSERSGEYDVSYPQYGRLDYNKELVKMMADVTDYVQIPLTATTVEAKKLIEKARVDVKYTEEFTDFPAIDVKIIKAAEDSSEASAEQPSSETISTEQPAEETSESAAESVSSEAVEETSAANAEKGTPGAVWYVIAAALIVAAGFAGFGIGKTKKSK